MIIVADLVSLRMECTYRNTRISAATHPRILNLVSNKFLVIDFFSRLSGMQFSHLSIHESLLKPENLRENSGKMGYTTQLFIALVYNTGTNLMLRQSSSTLVKYVNYLIVIFIINENCRSKRKFVKRKNQEKRCDKLTSQNSFTHLFNIIMT